MKKILVIEDTMEVRENLCEILELSNYEVYSAENGKDGLRKVIEYMPDLILCDVMMPELDGFGVLKILNQNPKVNHIPLIFLTAKADKTDIRKGMGLGADDYITKPFDDTELLEAIEIRLQKSERLRVNEPADNENSIKHFFSELQAIKGFEDINLDKEIRKFNDKDIIYEEQSNARWLFHVVEGQVKLVHSNDYGKELTTQLINAGEFFGYFALLGNGVRRETAIASTSTTLRLIPKDDFVKLLFNNRDFAALFIKMISNKTLEIEKQLLSMAYGSVREKVKNALLAYAGNTSDNQFILNVSRDDLASKAGTAKETLIRTLSDFKSEGIISIEKKAIVINDLQKLTKLIC